MVMIVKSMMINNNVQNSNVKMVVNVIKHLPPTAQSHALPCPAIPNTSDDAIPKVSLFDRSVAPVPCQSMPASPFFPSLNHKYITPCLVIPVRSFVNMREDREKKVLIKSDKKPH